MVAAKWNVLVTGASSDIGGAILKRFRQEVDVDLIATSWKGSIQNASPEWHCLSGINLECDKSLNLLADEVTRRFKSPFCIIHCAGNFWEHRPIPHTSVEFAKHLVLSHYLTLFGVVHRMLPIAKTLRGCRIIAFSCNSVAYNYPEMAAFTSSKAAVECLIKCIANEWAEHGVVANALALPTIQTRKVLDLGEKKPGTDSADYIKPDELADIVVHLLESVSGYENGNVIKLFKYNRSFFHNAYFERNPPYVGP
jgi:3-oxoacyl-[acyl-carrier protein] reductase